MQPRICSFCGQEYTPHHSQQKYCGAKCSAEMKYRQTKDSKARQGAALPGCVHSGPGVMEHRYAGRHDRGFPRARKSPQDRRADRQHPKGWVKNAVPKRRCNGDDTPAGKPARSSVKVWTTGNAPRSRAAGSHYYFFWRRMGKTSKASSATAKLMHDYLKQNPGKLASEICEVLGITESQFHSALIASESYGILFYEEKVRVAKHQAPNQIAYFVFEG